MRLNCNHYVCLEDIQYIINSNPRRLQKCPICRVLIANYGCNGNIINVGNSQNQQLNIIPYEESETDGNETYNNPNVNIVSDDEGYETDDIVPLYGGKRKTKYTRKNKKKLNKRKTNSRSKNSKRKINKKRKTKRAAF